MSLIRILLETPDQQRRSSQFTVACGVLYLGAGALLLVSPGAVQFLLSGEDYTGHEGALIRALGMAVSIIGWFYVFGGRSGSRQIVAASVPGRVIFVPAVLGPLAASGVFPFLLGAFAILDPILGLTAWYLLRREAASEFQPAEDGPGPQQS